MSQHVTAHVIAVWRQLAADADRRAVELTRQGAECRAAADAERRRAEEFTARATALEAEPPPPPPPPMTWRERIHIVAPETELTLGDVAEILGMTKGALYRRLHAERHGRARGEQGAIPYRRRVGLARDANGNAPATLDKRKLIFIAGEIRSWLDQHQAIEQASRIIVQAGVMVSAASPRVTAERMRKSPQTSNSHE